MGIMVVVVGVLVMIALLSCSKKDRNNPLDSNVASVSSPFVLTAGSNLKFCGLLLADIGKNLQHKQQTYSAELDKKVRRKKIEFQISGDANEYDGRSRSSSTRTIRR